MAKLGKSNSGDKSDLSPIAPQPWRCPLQEGACIQSLNSKAE